MHAKRFTVSAMLAALALPAAAPADTRYSVGYDPALSGFALYYDRYETDLRVEGSNVETRIEKLGISFTQYLAPNLSGDIELGYLATFQDDNPVTGDNKQYGEYLGLGLNAGIPLSPRMSLGGELDYAFNYADGDVNDVETEMSWREARARAYVDYDLGAARFRVGAQGQTLDGDLTFATTPSQTFVFDAADSTGAFAGIDLYVDNGRVSLYGQTGDRDGFILSFAAEY